MGGKQRSNGFPKSPLARLAVFMRPSECRRFRRISLAYPDPALTATELRFALTHVRECPACARFDSQLERAMEALRSALLVPQVSPGFNDRVTQVVRQSWISRQWRAWAPALMAAACASALIGVFVHSLTLQSDDESAPMGTAKRAIDPSGSAEPIFKVPPETPETSVRVDG